MNSKIPENFFTLKFEDKAEWNNFKEDLKSILREHEIKFQYSEKTPTFHILYKNDKIRLQVNWREETLTVNLRALKDLETHDLDACNEIFDLLNLFSGELIEGISPYKW